MILTTLLVFILVAGEVKAAEIDCENVGHFARFKCCFFNETTTIDAINVTFAGLENSAIDAIDFTSNKKIQFLPVEVYKKFPNLEMYLAERAAIKKISAVNFARLQNLKVLWLYNNRIEFVPDDCFQGLTKLHKIYLGTRTKQVIW